MSNRIKELRKFKKMSTKELGKAIGMSQQYISDIETGRTTPSLKTLGKIAKYFNVSIDFLLGKTNKDGGYLRLLFASKLREKRKKENLSLTDVSKILGYGIDEEHLIKVENAEFCEDWFWEYGIIAKFIGLDETIGEDLALYSTPKDKLQNIIGLNSVTFNNSVQEESHQRPYNKTNFDRVERLKYIPVLGVIRAGQPILAEENIEGFFPTDKQFISDKYEYFYLRITGDSMNKEFEEGNLVLVRKQDYIENGDIGVVLVNGMDATVKKIYIKNSIITLMPQSNNPEHQPQIYDIKKDEVKIIGRVMLAIKKY